MPYEVRKTDECPKSKPWGLFREGEKMSCHATKEDAESAQRAIEYRKHSGDDRLNALVALSLQRPRALAQPQASAAGSWYRISNQDGADEQPARIDVYDSIGGWMGMSAADFVRDVVAITASRIDLHINSPGGDVFDAIAMSAALRNHPAKVTSYVDGVAASAASFLAMAGDEVAIEKPASMMIHDASGLTYGNEADHRQMADLLGQISDQIAGIYADRAGGSVEDWRDAMRATSWYTSAQAVAAGLADRVLNDAASEPDTEPESEPSKQPEPAPAEGGTQDRRSQLIRARARVALKGWR